MGDELVGPPGHLATESELTIDLRDERRPNREREAEIDHAIVATVAYADVFDMPISLGRTHRFLVECEAAASEVAERTSALVANGHLGRRGDLLHLPGRVDVLVVHDERDERAQEMWEAAQRWGKRMGRVPFVRMVAVTGGLAVDSVADHDDIDYFVITAPTRLWLTRFMIVGLVKLAERENIELCPNYLVSERALDIDDRALYVARELAQMVPIVDGARCSDLRRRNNWMFDFLPNATSEGDQSRTVEISRSRFTALAELLLRRPMFDRVERWEMRRKIARLSSVASRRPEVGAPDESSFSADVCKGHMVGNAAGIDEAWQARLEAD